MPPEGTNFNGLTALVVEDETIIAFLIEDMLKDAGFRDITHAGSIPAAESVLENTRPDVAILDLNLAGVRSYPLAERLQAMKIPFVFASGYGTAGVSSDWQHVPIVCKPFQAPALMDALSTCLGTTK